VKRELDDVGPHATTSRAEAKPSFLSHDPDPDELSSADTMESTEGPQASEIVNWATLGENGNMGRSARVKKATTQFTPEFHECQHCDFRTHDATALVAHHVKRHGMEKPRKDEKPPRVAEKARQVEKQGTAKTAIKGKSKEKPQDTEQRTERDRMNRKRASQPVRGSVTKKAKSNPSTKPAIAESFRTLLKVAARAADPSNVSIENSPMIASDSPSIYPVPLSINSPSLHPIAENSAEDSLQLQRLPSFSTYACSVWSKAAQQAPAACSSPAREAPDLFFLGALALQDSNEGLT